MRLGCGMFLCSFAVLCCVCGTNGCGEITKPYGEVTVVYGEMSGAGHETWSVAICPRGTVVVHCTCSKYNHDNCCDGTQVILRTCTALTNRLNPGTCTGIQAVAFCKKGGVSDYEFVTQFPKAPLMATCAPGFKVLACGVRNPMSDKYCCYPEISGNGASCQMTEGTKGGKCWTYAICERSVKE